VVNTWFITKLWRTYRQNRRLAKAIRSLAEFRTIAWEVSDIGNRRLRERNAELQCQLERAETRLEEMAIRNMQQRYLLRDLRRGEKRA
jgi:hypothetical protein